MAQGHGSLTRAAQKIKRRRAVTGVWPGKLALGFLGLLCGGAIAGLVVEAAGDWRPVFGLFDARTFGIVRFTLWQAALSTFLAILPALAVARALSRHPTFFGREILLRLFAVPLALPAIVAALGVLALYGRSGLMADPLTDLFGVRWSGIYGLSGILIAHVFFNLPLATRLFLETLQTVPDDQWRLASQLGMDGRSQWRLIEWPVLRASLPGVAGLVFMLCATSFVIVLTLGGGPAATTLEVAIYQALRFDFDPARAVGLTVLQLLLTGTIVAFLARTGGRFSDAGVLSVVARRYAQPGRGEAVANFVVVVLAAAFVLTPMLATVAAGLKADLARLIFERSVLRAAATSVVLASAASVLSVVLSLSLITSRHRLATARREKQAASMLEWFNDSGANLILVMPPVVIGAGWFVLVRHFGDVFSIAPVMVICVNAAMAMPFVVRILRPVYDAAAKRHDRLANSLGIGGISRMRLIEWPVLRRPLLAGLAFSMALSLGDLGVIALFGSETVQTLPYLLLSRLGSYRTADAAGLALLLGAMTFVLMAFVGRVGGRK